MMRTKMMTQIDDLPPLRDVIRRHQLIAEKIARAEFSARSQSHHPHRPRRRAARGGDRRRSRSRTGGLTRALLALGAKRVIAIERDERAIAALEEISTRYPGRLDIVAGDALRFDPRSALAGARAKVVANLPYNIATALLVDWLTIEPWPPWYDLLVLMFQREVAERIVAVPGSKTYGRLSVLAGWRTQAKILFDVAPIGLRAAAEGDVFSRAACSARGAARLQRAGPATGD